MTLLPADVERWVQSSAVGPEWLVARRNAAAAAFAASPLPTERDEDFRYGRVDDLDLGAFAPARRTTAPGPEPPPAARLSAALGDRAIVVRTRDGAVASAGHAPAGVGISAARDAAGPPERYGSLLADVAEPFAALADALAEDAVVIEIDAGVVLEAPVLVVHEVSGGPGGAAAPRTFLRLGRGAEASVVELFVSSDSPTLVLPVAELELGAGSKLAYHALQQLGPATWQLGYQLSRLERDARLTSFSAALGGAYARLYTRSSLVEENAESRLLATYLGTGTQVQDLRTFQEHAAAHTTSQLVFKGAVGDSARSVYTGLIHIAKGARRSNAAQTNRNLVLSEGAHADSVPNLDIEENDVRCSHASAVGPIDREQRFYLESRGVPTEVAERLILLGFFEDLLDDVPEPGCGAYLREVFAERLEALR